MALPNSFSLSASKSLVNVSSCQPHFPLFPDHQYGRRHRISAVHVAAEQEKWSLGSWKNKKVLQLPEYPNEIKSWICA
ncbi:hypothetical protein RDI58_026121 [Solanum bulbocastanum]|uniref:Uncharacterized protein n=1 Tax=Solanum bulbocastanum TaxID=147425 RepID=A0AAN8Y0K3_SOLBU